VSEAPAARPAQSSYYGRPVLKPPVWKGEIPWYLFTGGLGGGSSTLALLARLARNEPLARGATLVAAGALASSPVLLVKDLGRPERFLQMFRVVKPTSPMNVGSWLLLAAGSASSAAAALELAGVLPRAKAVAQALAGLLGPAVSTYTAVLVSDTAVPVWHEARRELPFVFAAGAAASAAGAAVLVTDAEAAGPARRLLVLGAVAEEAAVWRMERSLGELLGEPYREGEAGRLARMAKAATVAGASLVAARGGSPRVARVGALATLAGAVLTRFSIFRAGFQSAEDPRYVVESQRARLEHGAAAGDRGA
jgi:hypothetical protein